MSESHIRFHVGDGDSLPFILTRLIGHTITVTLKDQRSYTGDIVDAYSEGGVYLTITDSNGQERDLDYSDIDAIEYA